MRVDPTVGRKYFLKPVVSVDVVVSIPELGKLEGMRDGALRFLNVPQTNRSD